MSDLKRQAIIYLQGILDGLRVVNAMLKFLKQLLCSHNYNTGTKFYKYEVNLGLHLVVYQQLFCSDCGKRKNIKVCDYPEIYWDLKAVATILRQKGICRIEDLAVMV